MRTPRSVPTSLLRFSPLAAALACVLVPEAMAATYIVNDSSNDTSTGTCFAVPTASSCTLHQAMQQAQSTCDTNALIQFDIPSPFTISPSFALPTITDCLGPTDVKVTLDGYSQPGAAANTASQGFNANVVVIIDGSSYSTFSCALQTSNFGYGEGGLALVGLEVRNFNYGGIPPICGAVEVLGSKVWSNSYGIDVKEPGFVGGVAPADRNLIYGNSGTGVNAYAGQVHIINNLIGTDATGTAGAGNDFGITMNSQGASGSTILNNVVSGNNFVGVDVQDSPSVTISGNSIGTDVTRSGAIPNMFGGLMVNCSPNATLVNNNISGNQYGGAFIAGTDGGIVQGNYIGMAADGATALPNGGNGLELSSSGFCGAAIMKSPVLFGTNAMSLSGNVIANNSGTGLYISGGGDNDIISNTIKLNQGHGVSIVQGTGNLISGNSIYSNALAGAPFKNIDLDYYGGLYDALPNDAGDIDTGPNDRQNHPVVSMVTQSGGNTMVTWSLNSGVSRPYQVEFFSNLAAGVPAGKTLIDTSSISTDGTGNYSQTSTISGAWDNISMTAIDLTTSDTSEFSLAVAVTPTPDVTISPNPKNFGNVIVGSSLGPLGITVTSVGSAPYVINAFDSSPTCYGGPICSSGAFICANSCTTGTPYAPSASCGIDVTFAPSALGPASTTFYICDNAAGSPRVVTLLGNGIAPPPVALSISPIAHDFGTVLVGSSATHSFTISNPGTGDATLSGPPTATGPFQVDSTTCGTILAASADCLANVSFVPVTNGNAAGTLTVSAAGATASATLVGTGLRQSVLEMTSSLIDLGSTALGGAPLTRPVSLRNAGNAALTIDRISVGLPFTLDNGCPLNLLPDETCVVTLGLNPTEVGTFDGSLTVVTNAPGGSRSVPVRGQVQVRPEPVVRVSPASIGFGERMGGSQAPAQRITVTNEGGADAAGVDLSINSPHFLVVNTTCGNVLAAQSTCFADVAFQPSGFGPKRASFSVNSTAPTASTALSGAGCRPPPASPGRGTRLSCAP